MSTAAKAIIGGLKAAKVSAADQARSKSLIDKAEDGDQKQAAEVEAVVRYVCGIGELPKKLSRDFLEYLAEKVLDGLSKDRKLDGWDARALDVMVKAKKEWWKVDIWLSDRVVKYPGEPIFEEALVLVRARGLWPDDKSIIASMVGYLTAHVTKKGELTSTGRWLLAQLDRDARAVLKVAREQEEDQTSSLYGLLLAHRRQQFDKLLPTLGLADDSDRSLLAGLMLEANAKHYEKQAVAVISKITAPIPAVLSARHLERFFPGKYRAEVKRLLLAAVKAKSDAFYDDTTDDERDSHEAAATLAWKALGEEALDIWKAYDDKNHYARLEVYGAIARQAKVKAVPALIDGLVYSKDLNVEYGGIDHVKYVQRMVAMLKPYNLAPYRERIEKAFAKNTNKKIREQIDGVLGAVKQGKPKSTTRSFAGTDGYRFEAYADAVTKAALAAVKKAKQVPSPIEQVKLGGMQGDVQLNWLMIEGGGDQLELELAVPRSKVPRHVDDDDRILASFAKLHALEPDEAPGWGDMYKLPWCVLLHEQIVAAQAIAAGLRKQGHKLVKGCKVGVGGEDDFWESAAGFEQMSREEVEALPEPQQADFAAVCFEDPKRQRWLRKR